MLYLFIFIYYFLLKFNHKLCPLHSMRWPLLYEYWKFPPPPKKKKNWRKISLPDFSKICGTFYGIYEVNLLPFVKHALGPVNMTANRK